ncbi:MAG: hypothetical protein O3C39_02405 [Planctomycetota bacterium]|nr:hypothetical protein [Planctomycetota bacterium]
MLQRPFFTPVAIGFWCITSGWLVAAKILPAWQPGAPPGHQGLYATAGGLAPVAWTVSCNGRPIGGALTRSIRSERAGVFVDSRLHFDSLPWNEILPGWATRLVTRLMPADHDSPFDARGRLAIDDAGKLRSFSSVVQLPGRRHPLVLTGTVNEGAVTIHVAAGELRYEVTRHVPTDMMIGDELSPQAMLPGLEPGRRWTVPVYSPLRPGQSPLEILHAEVGDRETIFWDDTLIAVHVVNYREELSSDREPRCRLWVDQTGRVLRQEAALLGARLTFDRRSDDEAARMASTEYGGDSPLLPTIMGETP